MTHAVFDLRADVQSLKATVSRQQKVLKVLGLAMVYILVKRRK